MVPFTKKAPVAPSDIKKPPPPPPPTTTTMMANGQKTKTILPPHPPPPPPPTAPATTKEDGGKKQQKRASKDHHHRHGGLAAIRRFFRAVRRQLKRTMVRSKKTKRFEDDSNEMAKRNYECRRVLGMGTFGIVYKAIDKTRTSRTQQLQFVAVKKITLDSEFETREVEIHRFAKHQNVVSLRETWSRIVEKGRSSKVHIYLVMDYMPKSLEEHIVEKAREHSTMSTTMIKVLTFQMFKGLNYLHKIRIFHRDIKPSNLLVNAETGILKVCDFGCAKKVKHLNGLNRTYICSRFYRAPELVMNNPRNDETIDVWAGACVLAECFRGWPLFPGKSTLHQFGAIADVLGNPRPIEVRQLNPRVREIRAKRREANGTFDQHFPMGTPEPAIDLLSRILIYRPKERLTALGACADPYYDQLRNQWKTMRLPAPSQAPLPASLFKFSAREFQSTPLPVIRRILPKEDEFKMIRVAKTPIQHKKKQTQESISTETDVLDESGSADVFSELESSDVEEGDVWDSQRVRVLLDDESSDSGSGRTVSNK